MNKQELIEWIISNQFRSKKIIGYYVVDSGELIDFIKFFQSHPQKGLNLESLSKRVDEALSKETPESLKKFLESHKPETTAEEMIQKLWDKYSEYIDDDIDSLQMVAGHVIIRKEQFWKAMEEYAMQGIELPSDDEAIDKARLLYPYKVKYDQLANAKISAFMDCWKWFKQLITNK